MDNLILALGPAFAAGLALQQLLELADRFIEQGLKLTGPLGLEFDKKLILGAISLLFGFLVAVGADIRVLRPLGVTQGDFIDVLITALIISAGTESINAIVKFLGYVKEDRKMTAQVKKQQVDQNGSAKS